MYSLGATGLELAWGRGGLSLDDPDYRAVRAGGPVHPGPGWGDGDAGARGGGLAGLLTRMLAPGPEARPAAGEAAEAAAALALAEAAGCGASPGPAGGPSPAACGGATLTAVRGKGGGG